MLAAVIASIMLAACTLSRDGTILFGSGNPADNTGGASSSSGFGNNDSQTSTGGGLANDGSGGGGATGGSGTGDGGSGGSGGSGDPEPIVWNSWDVVTNGSTPQVSGNGYAADIAFYRSVSLTDLAIDTTFDQYHAGPHPESFNNIEMYWATNSNAGTYPYAGKSTVDRGNDNGETAAPQPLNVRDLQLHPPDADKLTVMAFAAPLAATYTVSNLALRRVDSAGELASVQLHAPCTAGFLEKLQAGNNQAWVVSSQTYALGQMSAGERICFGVSGVGDYGWDAVEIAWTLTAQP